MRPSFLISPILFFAMVLASGSLRADVSAIGTTSGKFLQLGSSARAAAMGEAYVALSDEAGGIFYNPAGLANIEEYQVQGTHTEWFKGARVENLNAVFPVASGVWGGSFGGLLLPTQDITEVNNANWNSSTGQPIGSSSPTSWYNTVGSFTPFDLRGTLAYARSWHGWLQFGASLNVLLEQINTNSAVGLSGDLGLQSETGIKGLRAGLSAQNLGGDSRIISEGFQPPLYLRMGLAYHLMEEALVLSAEGDDPIDNNFASAAGAEWRIGGGIYLRGGLRFDSIFNPWTAGVGAKLWSSMLDLSTSSAGDLGQTYRASLSFNWGGQVAQGRAVDLHALNTFVSRYSEDSSFRLEPLVEAHRPVDRWTLGVYGPGQTNTLVRSVNGEGRPRGTVRWDGRGSTGQAGDGKYRAVLAVSFKDGKTEYSPYQDLEINSGIPETRLEFDEGSYDSTQPNRLFVPALLHVRTPDLRLTLRWRLDIISPDGTVFQSIEGRYGDNQPVLWEGHLDNGQQFISNATYRFRLSVLDKYGKVLREDPILSRLCVFRQ
jgi:hypothetical protein